MEIIMKRIISVLLMVILAFTATSCVFNKKVECSNCGEKVEKAAFCPACGKALAEDDGKCDKCGEELPKGAKFCPKCGEENVSQNKNDKNDKNDGNGENNDDTNDGGALFPNDEKPEEKTVWLKQTERTGDIETVYFYNDNGKMTGKRSTYLSNGKLSGATEYILDEHGNVKEERYMYPTFSTIGNYNVYNKYTYENQYNSNGDLYTVKKSSSQSGLFRTFEYNYASSGALTEMVERDSYGDTDTITVYYEDGRINYVDEDGYKTVYNYGSDGRLTSIKRQGVDPEVPESGAVNDGVLYETVYKYDEDGNIVSEQTGGSVDCTYTYITLDEYVSQGKHQSTIAEMADFPSYIGKAKCSHCSSNGHDYCIGHTCPTCNGAGSERCAGCHGTGKGPMILGSDACRVCYGMGTQICPNCDGAKKKFYTN
ncbi:MAG: zinc ribbon domain-containing protein [Clostridia bacterium]|nr:zinc ribbon domain-containing protein [Clostridia bacterium]